MNGGASYTPGPWRVDVSSGRVYGGDGGQWVASVDCPGPETDAEVDANARLIAAAPGLLEAGRRVVDAWTQGDLDRVLLCEYCIDHLANAVRLLADRIEQAGV